MPEKKIAVLLFALIFPIAARAQAADDENAHLRAEITALKARNELLERACPAAANVNSATPDALPAPTASGAAAAAPIPQPSAAAAMVNLPPQRYTNTGCDRGIFSGPPPAKWQDSKVWVKIGKGMTMAEVEAAVGVDHYDEENGQSVQWQYGRCGGRWAGSVTFVDGLVISKSAPE